MADQFTVSKTDEVPEIIAGINVNEHQTAFEEFRSEQDQRIENLTELFESIHDLAELKHQMYQVRQKLVSEKYKLQDKSNAVNRNYRHMRRDIAKSYLMGQRKVQHSAIVLKNKDERDTFHEADLRSVIWMLDTLDNQINWTIDSLKTVDNLIFGIPYAIELESKYRNAL